MERAGDSWLTLAASTIWAAMLCALRPLVTPLHWIPVWSSIGMHIASVCSFSDHSLDAHHCFGHQYMQGKEM